MFLCFFICELMFLTSMVYFNLIHSRHTCAIMLRVQLFATYLHLYYFYVLMTFVRNR